jgi:hypothetical protein
VTNPYTSSKHSHTAPRKAPSRFARLLLVCLGAGAIAAVLVYVGDALEWPHFNCRAGYFGTEFMGQLLYAINDPYAIHIVAVVWFLYAAVATGLLLVVFRMFSPRRSGNDA